MATSRDIARTVTSSRGGLILEFLGYRYYKVRSDPARNAIHWRCIDRDNCRGTCKTNFNLSAGIVVELKQKHLHESVEVEIQVADVVRAIKRRAQSHPNEPPATIFAAEIENVNDEEVISQMPQRNDIIRNINRIQNRHRPMNTSTLENLIIHEPYNRTKNGELFCQYDSVVESREERFIMFYTLRDLERLCSSRMLLGDGTFKVVPSMFYQLYTFHGVVHGYAFPLVYCICTNKTESIYRRMLTRLLTHAGECNFDLNPQVILSDFELAFMNAARTIFPNSSVKGCLFHFTQSIWKRTVTLGLKQQYKNDEITKNVVRELLTLPFVQLNDIVPVFQSIVATIPEDEEHDRLFDLVSYFENTYIRGRNARRGPRFPPSVWCVHELVVTKQNRSTNCVEGWHSRFQRLILSHHAGIWKFIEHIQLDQRQNDIMMIQLGSGHTRVRYPMKAQYKRNMEQIEIIVSNYNNYKEENNILAYLKTISYKIKLNLEEAQEEQEEEQEE